MGFFDWISGKKREGAHDFPDQFPWDRHPSAYEHILAHIRPDQPGLAEGGESLPDEEKIAANSKIRWAAGAMDGVTTHHMAGDNSDQATELLNLTRTYWEAPTALNKAKVYAFLTENTVVSLIDPFVQSLRAEANVNHERLYDLAKSLATESPDREPAKFGITVLGLYGQDKDREVFLTLGRHDEFTLFCAVALGNAYESGEEETWELAKNVHGWGRVHIVERLADTTNPEIKEWLLRDGYKNSVMYEYLAYPCAEGGGLLAALEREDVDNDLLVSANEIIQALIGGGPAQNMDDYEDGASVVQLFLDQMQRRASSLTQLLTVTSIRDFLTDKDADWESRASRGWTPDKRESMLTQCSEIIHRAEWRDRVLAGLKSEDEVAFFNADRAATVLGIDTWPFHWDRIQKKPLDSGRWFNAMKCCNDDRIADLLALAESTLPLDKIGTGPGTEIGLGPGYEGHSCLDYILQELGRFPGYGERLIEVGLRSSTIRNRNMALKVLSEWGKDNCPANMDSLLEQARQREPDDDVRRRIENVLAGKPLEENAEQGDSSDE